MTPMNNAEYLTRLQNSQELEELKKAKKASGLGVFFAIINCICLVFVRIHTIFNFNYINYFDLLIFCCQSVATEFF